MQIHQHDSGQYVCCVDTLVYYCTIVLCRYINTTADSMYVVLTKFLNDTTDSVEHELGRCQPLYDALNVLIDANCVTVRSLTYLHVQFQFIHRENSPI